MHVTVSTIAEAVVDVMKAATPGGVVDQTLAARISGEIAPALQKALIAPVSSGAELSGLGVFRNILSQHFATPASAYVESETRKAMQRTLETANRTGSEFSSLIAGAGSRLLHGVATEGAREGNSEYRAGERISAALKRDAPLDVNGAIGFAKELGISPSYAGLFAGGSQEMRTALRDAIKNGKAITDDSVKSMKDVGMVLGAIRAGKLKPDDPRIPQSVRGVIEDMKKKGIDPAKADAKTIKKYLDENPKALEAAKTQNVTDKKAAGDITPEQRKGKVEASPTRVAQGAKPKGAASL